MQERGASAGRRGSARGWRLGHPALLFSAASSPRPHAAACARRKSRGRAGAGCGARPGQGRAAAGAGINFLCSSRLFLLLCSRRRSPPSSPSTSPARSRCPHLPVAFVSAKPPHGAARDTPGAPRGAKAPGSCDRTCYLARGGAGGSRRLPQRGERAEAGDFTVTLLCLYRGGFDHKATASR